MKVLSIDIETYSDISLIDLGVYKYVDSPNFQILLFAYSVDGGQVQVVDLKNGEELPEEIEMALLDESVIKTAFNAQFERVCLDRHLRWRYLDALPDNQLSTGPWECTMIKAWTCGIGGGLASVGAALGLSEDKQKMKEGKALIQKFSVPNPRLQGSLLDDSDWQLFKDYCRRDVEVELEIREKLMDFPTISAEKKLYAIDQEINDNGIRLDMELVENAISIDAELMERETKRFQELTGMENPNSLVDIKRFIKERTGEDVKSITKDTSDDLIKKFSKINIRSAKDVVEVLKIRQLLSKTSTAKYPMMRDVVMADGRTRGNIQFYGALRTGRWAGRLIQVHNLPQNHISDLENAREIVKYGDLDLLEMAYDNPPDILSQCLRTAIIPAEGKKFIVSDFSAIEARVIAWFAGEKWVLDVFKDHGKIYEATASKMFGVPIEEIHKGSQERQKGKVATLALGYQGGVGALKQMGGDKLGLYDYELKELADTWRRANPNIVRFWNEVEKAFKRVIDTGVPEKVAGGRLRIYRKKGIVFIQLPSGRSIAYPKARLEPHEKFENATQIVYSDRNSAGTDWIDRTTYGGSLVENIVQAAARDCLAYSIMRLYEEGYMIVMHVHDEVILEIDKDTDELDRVLDIMGEEIPWAPGLPLKADGYECEFYKKD